jgi:predicted transcriptional regulator
VIPVAIAQGGYEVAPNTTDPSGEYYVGDDSAVSFWQLPAWIQLFYAVALITACVGFLKFLPVIRGKIENLLENQNRNSILQYVNANPGSTIARIAQDQLIDRATVKYHLYKLEAGGKVVLRRMGKYARIFRNSGAFSADEQKVIAHLQNRNSSRILSLIMDNPGITNQELAEQLGIEKGAVHWHIDRFMADGLISVSQEGRQKRYFVGEDVKPVLRKHAGDAG